MSIKLITTDLDGTLMAPDHITVTERTVTALKMAHDRGVKIAIATGRPMSIIKNVTDQIDFVDYIIYSNGACVYDRNENCNLFERLIPNQTAIQAVEFILEYPVFFEVYIKGRAHYQLGSENYFVSESLPQEFLNSVMSEMVGHKDIISAIGKSDIEKLTLYSIRSGFEAQLEKKFKSLNLFIASSLKNNMEATAKNADKGEALKEICKIIGISTDEAMCFGDSKNDCEMMHAAKFSFAMGNATKECKAAANYLTASNADDGLAKAVEKFVLR